MNIDVSAMNGVEGLCSILTSAVLKNGIEWTEEEQVLSDSVDKPSQQIVLFAAWVVFSWQ